MTIRRLGPHVLRQTAVLGALLALCLAIASHAIADTTPIPRTPALSWADSTHQSPIEVLAGKIASHIAGRTVSVRCEGPVAWTALTGVTTGQASEAGFVSTTWDSTTGELLTTSDYAELDGGSICRLLQSFAAATTKPTQCLSAATPQVFTTAVEVRPATQVSGPCYLTDGREAAPMTPAFWASYALYAVAILTLAHESIHLAGIVGGKLGDGLEVGDQLAEAKADCYGMQWMPYVARQLGDTRPDAQAIADYYWRTIYQSERTSIFPQYWSANCANGRALDLHLSNWP